MGSSSKWPNGGIEPKLTYIVQIETTQYTTPMTGYFNSITSLKNDLRTLGVREGDGLFVHASMHAIGSTIGGAREIGRAHV